ncbi:MAG: flagellar hook protein FlgE [Roseiarcus sp.]|jgi:flagellar hook protein FlgE
MSLMGAAVSGMLADTNWLSTISQNVSNADTTGYKNVETEFSTLVDQAGGAADSLAGVATSIRALNSLQGSVVGTSTTTDLAIQGSGYFVVSDSSGALYLTRNGSFVPDAEGNLVNSAGYYLMGNIAGNGQADAVPTQKVNVTAAGDLPTATDAGVLSVNLPSNSSPVTNAADLPSANPPAEDASYTAETSVTAYDDLGGEHTINVYLTNTGVATAGPNAGDDTWQITAYDAADAAATGGFPYTTTPPNTPLKSDTLYFSSTTGALMATSEGTTNLDFNIPIPNGKTLALDISGTTQLAANFSVNTNTTNGNAPSSLEGVTISADGTLDFQYSNGASNAAYDIPLATVASPDSLTSLNGNVYQANQNSGSIVYGTAGTGGLGAVVSSSLEDSTVDLATELTDMIEAQSAYQANSKVFQTGADLLDILNNLKS